MIELKGGRTTNDRRLDRIPQFHPKNRLFAVREVLPDKPLHSYTWRGYTILDQGSQGACVGFGWAHELLSRPRVVRDVDDAFARNIYNEARKVDEWPGEQYEGTSVLAGAKTVQTMGHIREYRWGFSVEDVLLALGYIGPVVLGLQWYTGMMDTDAEGFIKPTGVVEGGHCVEADQINVRGDYIAGPNSWSFDWGIAGRWKMQIDDFRRLLAEEGEACIPVGRLKVA